MTAMALENIDEYCEPNLPAECLLDPYNPANDKYYKTKSDLERRIIHASSIMRPKQVLAVKKRFSGASNKEIAEALKVAAGTVSGWFKKPEAQRLRSLLAHYGAHIDGPNTDHRKAILHRIVVDNEIQKPTVAISAIAELNRMTGAYDTGIGSGGTSVTVIVQHPALEKSPLDG